MKSENNPRDKAFPHKSQSSPPSLVARLFPFLGLLLTVAVTAWVFLQVRGFDFINYDDPLYVTQNPQVLAGWTMEGLRWAFTAWHASNWHPLTWLSLMTDVELFGPGAGALHAVSAGLHLANVLLVYLAVFSLTGRRGAALLTAALFGVHPLHVESVAWISERKDVLSCFFSLLAIIAYTRYARSGRFREYVASLALFAAALLAKPMAVTLPLVLLLLDAWPLGRIQANPRQVLKEKIPFFLLSLGSAVMTLLAQYEVGVLRPLEILSLSVRAANALVAYATYLDKTVFPVDLAVFYPHPGMPPAGEILLAVGVLAGISLAAVLARKKAPYLALGWAWYLVTLLPVIGLVQVGSQAMADRYTYFPLLGPFLALSMGLTGLALKRPAPGKILTVAVAATAILVLAFFARGQVMVWQNSATLFEKALASTQDNWLAHDNLGSALMDQGETSRAIPHFLAATSLNPDYHKAANNLGLALARKGRYAQAIPWLARAVELSPGSWPPMANLGETLVKAGEAKKAIPYLVEARRLRPDLKALSASLGRALFLAGRPEEAEAPLREALEGQENSAPLHNLLGAALLAQGKRSLAVAHFRRALDLDPAYRPARDNLEAATAERAGPFTTPGEDGGKPPGP